MKTQEKLDILNNLFGAYYDLELENFKLASQLLKKPIRIDNLVPLTKEIKFINILRNNFKLSHKELVYLRSFDFQYYGINSLHEIRKPIVSIFHDDFFEIELLEPSAFACKKIYSAQYLFDILKQGANGVIPSLVKESTGRNLKSLGLEKTSFSISIKLIDSNENSNRSKILNQIDFLSSDAEIFKHFSPPVLFERILKYNHNDYYKDLVIERLKLWGMSFSLIDFNTISNNLFVTLPFNDFNIKNILLLNQVKNNFHQNISNEVLLTGELNGNIFFNRHLSFFNKKLKNLLDD